MKLMETGTEKLYVQKFKSVGGLIAELKLKNKIAKNDIQLGLDTIYGFLMLRMKKANISAETENAVKQLSQWLSNLSKLYKDFELGDFEF
jgi:flagellin-specific chaperone FliS